jgi:penicillin-insensitive murein endopeptidase
MRRPIAVLLVVGAAFVAPVALARPQQEQRNTREDGRDRPGSSEPAARAQRASGSKDRADAPRRSDDRGKDPGRASRATPADARSGKTREERERERLRGPGARALPHTSRSVGLPFRGRLRRGVAAEENGYLRFAGEYASSPNRFGTWELVQLLERAAFRVHQRAPGAKLSIGELSAESGGDVQNHASHENGRDVDVAFYMLDGRGRPVEPFGFANFRGDGTALPPNTGLTFDDRRNFELVQKLVTDGDARVQWIFVANAIKRRVLAEARRQRARPSVIERIETVMAEPQGEHPHRNHFHVRIYCAPADRPACEDRAPFHPWSPGALRRALPSALP